MRKLNDFEDERLARQWADALWANGVECTVRTSSDGSHGIWVHDDAQMDAARTVLSDPGSSPAKDQVEAGRRRREEFERARSVPPPKHTDARSLFASPWSIGAFTAALIVVCLGMALATLLGKNTSSLHYFTINDFAVRGDSIAFRPGLHSVAQGQVWRLLSPIFLHFGILHLFFNLWWLKDLGTAVERMFSGLYLVLLVAVVGVASNIGEYLITGNPLFGGMSGVVYGLFAFLWVRGRLDPTCPVKLADGTALILLIWYGLCWTGLVGNVANITHTVGLILGAAWGAVSSGAIGRRLGR